jgi:adenylate cyclase class 2
MKEVEVKAKLRNKEKVMEKLESLGCVFEAPVTQDDTVYAENIESLEIFRKNTRFLRLRVKNGNKILFTIKEKGVNDLDSIEHETEVGSREQMEGAIKLLGYKEMVRVKKTRVITHYKGDEICIDEVEELGSYIEMERLTETGDSNQIQDELFSFFESIGIDRKDRVTYGYDLLLLEKRLAK